MSSEQHSGASSPLSSAPSNIATPSSKRHRDESDEKDSPAQGPDQDFNSELGDEWGEDVFNDNLPKNADATSGNDPPKNYSAPAPLLPAAPSPVNDDGFSKSELERAIAASLGVTEQSDPEKRKAVALEAAVAFREWDKSSGSPPMKFNPSYRYLRPILAKPAALKKQAAAAAAKPAAKKRRIEMLTTSMRSPLIQRDLRVCLFLHLFCDSILPRSSSLDRS